MSKDRNAFVAGLFIIASFALGATVLVLIRGHGMGPERVMTASFKLTDDLGGLAVGDDVRIGGVKVGNVNQERLDPESFQAVVGLSVRNDIRLPKDSAAIVTSESLLGGKYLSLQPGGDETMLQPGQTITITQSSVSLEELLGKFIFSITNAKPGENQPGAAKP